MPKNNFSKDQPTSGDVAAPDKAVSEASLRSAAWACMGVGAAALTLCGLGWVRMFSVAFAASWPDALLLVSAILLAIAAGFLAQWKLARSETAALRTYGICQVGVGVTGAAVTAFVFMVAGAAGSRGAGGLGAASEWLVAFLVFLVPGFLQGMALGAFRRFVLATSEDDGEWIGTIAFGVALMAAGAGAGLGGFLFLGGLGLRGVAYVGCVFAALSGISILVLMSQSAFTVKAYKPAEATRPLPAWSSALVIVTSLLMVFLAAGVLIAWRRLASLLLGPLSYATTVYLFLILISLGAGVVVGALILRRRPNTLAACGIAFLALGGFAYVSLLLWPELFWLAYKWHRGPLGSVAAGAAADSMMVGLAIMLPSMAIGGLVPTGIAALARRGLSADSSSRIFVSAGLAAVAVGLAMGGWPLFSTWGTPGTVVAAGVVACIFGAIGVSASPLGSNAKLGGVCGAVVLAFLISLGRPGWNRALFASGPSVLRPGMSPLRRAQFFEVYEQQAKFKFPQEESLRRFSAAGADSAGNLLLTADGFALRTLPTDMQSEAFAAATAMLVAPSDDSVLFLGYGTGLGARLAADIRKGGVTVVEPDPAFARIADAVLRREPSSAEGLVVENPRRFLRGRPQSYDVIVSHLNVPWLEGWGQFFTREFYSLAKDALVTRGVFGQLLEIGFLPYEDLKNVVGTFRSVFPKVIVFAPLQANSPHLFLIGSDSEMRLDLSKLRSVMEREDIAANFKATGMATPIDFLAALQFGDRELELFFGEISPPTTLVDSVPGAELSMQRITMVDVLKSMGRVWQTSAGHIAFAYLAEREQEAADRAEVLSDLADAYLRVGRVDRAIIAAREAVKLVEDRRTLGVLATVYSAAGELDDAERIWKDILAMRPDDVEILMELVKLSFSRQEDEATVSYLERVLALEPDDGIANFYMGRCLFKAGKKEEATLAFEKAALDEAAVKEMPPILYNLGACYADPALREYEKAVATFAKYVKAASSDALGYYHLGGAEYFSSPGDKVAATRKWETAFQVSAGQSAMLLGDARSALVVGDVQEAERRLVESLSIFSYNRDALLELARLQYDTGRVAAAIKTLEKIVKIYPKDVEAYYQLGAAFEALGDTESAVLNYRRYVALGQDFEAVSEVDRKLKALLGRLPPEVAGMVPLWEEISEFEEIIYGTEGWL